MVDAKHKLARRAERAQEGSGPFPRGLGVGAYLPADFVHSPNPTPALSNAKTGVHELALIRRPPHGLVGLLGHAAGPIGARAMYHPALSPRRLRPSGRTTVAREFTPWVPSPIFSRPWAGGGHDAQSILAAGRNGRHDSHPQSIDVRNPRRLVNDHVPGVTLDGREQEVVAVRDRKLHETEERKRVARRSTNAEGVA